MEAQSPKTKEYEEVEWKVSNDCEETEFGRVLKTPIALGDHDASSVHSYFLTPSVQGNVNPDVASYTKLRLSYKNAWTLMGLKMNLSC